MKKGREGERGKVEDMQGGGRGRGKEGREGKKEGQTGKERRERKDGTGGHYAPLRMASNIPEVSPTFSMPA